MSSPRRTAACTPTIKRLRRHAAAAADENRWTGTAPRRGRRRRRRRRRHLPGGEQGDLPREHVLPEQPHAAACATVWPACRRIKESSSRDWQFYPRVPDPMGEGMSIKFYPLV